MTQNEATLLGFKEDVSPELGNCYTNTICGLPMVIANDNGNWYLTIDYMLCTVRYYVFAEAQAFLNNLERHNNGK